MNGENIQVAGGMSGTPEGASKGKRFAVAVIDLVFIPILLGVVAGLALLAVPEWLRNIILILVNITWLVIRDAVYSPGRKMVGLKLVSLTGEKVTMSQAFIRNLLLMVPFVLVVGYLIEIIMIATKGERLADRWAKTRVVPA